MTNLHSIKAEELMESEEIDEEEITYGTYSAATQERTASIEGVEEAEVQRITPRFLVDGLVPVATCAHTRVVVSETELTLIEVSGREWARQYDADAVE